MGELDSPVGAGADRPGFSAGTPRSVTRHAAAGHEDQRKQKCGYQLRAHDVPPSLYPEAAAFSAPLSISDSSRDVPSSAIVTPYMTSAASIVRRLCEMSMNCV